MNSLTIFQKVLRVGSLDKSGHFRCSDVLLESSKAVYDTHAGIDSNPIPDVFTLVGTAVTQW